ncbi:vacuolar (H+)-ATPase G subunit [Ancylostoma duodenale]|uniref:Vacuolar (H+)-ATPase G subunit n=1 Tax=Ancylostoma duodenale TaxID=51022 RepID=A0A0C2DHB1_9BILA|nr:vacuolar (H+)-ATPase G subunit [Ancylostoma duodenale]
MSTASLGDEAANFYSVWEVEAYGRSKIMEAQERRKRRIKEAHSLAQVEIERFRQQKEAEFNSKCKSFDAEDEKRKNALIREVERELDYMDNRVHLCKPILSNAFSPAILAKLLVCLILKTAQIIELLEILTTSATYCIHNNVETRRWIKGLDKRATIPPNRRQCDEKTWELLQQYALKCEKAAAVVPRPTE